MELSNVEEILKGYLTLLPLKRRTLKLFDEALDKGTNSLMSDYIRETEKISLDVSIFY